MELAINKEKFLERLERLQTNWLSQKASLYNSADALCIPLGTASDSIYSKSSAFHLYFFGNEELTDSIILMTKNTFYFMSSTKKCAFVQQQLGEKLKDFSLIYLERTKDEGQNREHFNRLMNAVRKGGNKRLGILQKDKFNGNFIPLWEDFVKQSQIETADIAPALGLFFSWKDDTELELCRRASVLTNKVMKHGFVEEMENILDKDIKISHKDLAKKMEGVILDPSKIGLKLAADTVESCYDPIIQSGGKYDIKLSALSNDDNLSGNVILCSLGARYKSYCASISRTFLVDVPQKIETTYGVLLSLYNRCLEQMTKGNELKDVYEGAKKFLTEKDPSLLAYLPKSFGFATGLEFRDGTLLLNATNSTRFVPGMVFNLSVGFHNIPLTEDDTASSPEAVKKLSVFSLLIADIVTIQNEGVPEILTKLSKEFSDVSYKIGDQEGEDEDGDDEDADEGPAGTELVDGVRRSTRAREEKVASEVASNKRAERQNEIMRKKLEEGRKRTRNGGVGTDTAADQPEVEAKDLTTYKGPEEYPRDLIPNRLKVDLEKEAVLIPINGRHVPFHVSTIKSVTQPDPELRINFYVPGQALGKEAAKNMQYLVVKYGPTSVFIKELTFRSHDGKNLASFYQQFQELRRRVRQREQKAEQEKDLVVQTKLIRIKDQRVPRLQEVTIRPQLSGRKCIGTLEAHQNGLRFTSNKAEILDVMYSNIKHAIFQPCDRTTMVLVHFHLKDFILIGRKKQKDVQFYTEVIESSLNLEGSRRSAYDPDELDDEQREREMRKRLNLAFKEFCSKVEKVAAHYDFNLQIDVPFKKSGFEGNWSKEMVVLQPTTNCLVNLTEWPPFVITLSEVEHCHMERVTYATKNFDLSFIFKNWDLPPRTITAIDTKYMDVIQDWLNLVEITCTKGPRTINWTDVMKIVRETKDIFYDSEDEYGESKPSGWLFLSAEASDSEDDELDEADSDFSQDQDSDEDEEEASDEDDSELYDESESDSDEYDEEEDLEEKGQTWEELEREARAADKAKRTYEEENDERPKKMQKKR